MSAGVTDALGRRHPPAGPTARIVSLVPSITELLFDLGLAARVVGRTSFCVHPRPAVDAVPRVGGTKTPRLDRIRDLAPSHVVVNVDENRREDAEALAAGGITVIATHPLAPADNPALYRLLGHVFGCGQRAAALTREFETAHRALLSHATARRRRRVLYLIWRRPWMTVSRDTYVSRALSDAGLDTVAHDPARRYPEIALSPALLADAEAVLLSSEPFPFKAQHATELREAACNPRLPVHFVDGEMTSWYGSRAIAGCRYLARLACELDPEAHGDDVAPCRPRGRR
jgi:ABC-type Fe3+-hydroxamate transport system substrate-binding protein